jgi:hypothetical protein
MYEDKYGYDFQVQLLYTENYGFTVILFYYRMPDCRGQR